VDFDEETLLTEEMFCSVSRPRMWQMWPSPGVKRRASVGRLRREERLDAKDIFSSERVESETWRDWSVGLASSFKIQASLSSP